MVHSTAATYVNAECNRRRGERKSVNMITNEQNLMNQTGYKTKKARYEGFCQIIKKLESSDPCQTKHTFIFPVLTAWGEMSQDFTFIQEWMVKKFADNRLRHKSNDEGR